MTSAVALQATNTWRTCGGFVSLKARSFQLPVWLVPSWPCTEPGAVKLLLLLPPSPLHVLESGRQDCFRVTEVGPGKMAAPLELSCWGGGWGLPSVHSESLVVMVRPRGGPGRGGAGLACCGLPAVGGSTPGPHPRAPAH